MNQEEDYAHQPQRTIDPQDAAFGELCDQLFHADPDEPFWDDPPLDGAPDTHSLALWERVGVRACPASPPMGAGLPTLPAARPQVPPALTLPSV